MKSSVILYPHDSLAREAEPLTLDYIQSTQFRHRVSYMFNIMYRNNGVGLSAPQVGWNARLFIVNPAGRAEHSSKSFVFINPELAFISGEQVGEEGCLSLPGIYLPVKRYNKIRVKALNELGREYEVEADGFVSRIIQHENDHLHGIMMIDRIDTKSIKHLNNELLSQVKRIKRLRRKRELEYKRREKEKKKKLKSRLKSKARKKRKR